MGETRVRSQDPASVPPWLGVYLRPTRTLRAILDEDPRRHVTLLVAIAALAAAIVFRGISFGASNIWQWYRIDVDEPLRVPAYWPRSVIGTIFTVTLVVFPLAWLSLQVIAAATWWFGRMLGGTGRLVEIRCAMAWSLAPALTLVAMAVVALTGMEALGATWGPLLGAVMGAAALVGAVIAVLAFLAEAHRFTLWRAVGTIAFVVASIALLGRLVVFVVGTKRFLECVRLLSRDGSSPW